MIDFYCFRCGTQVYLHRTCHGRNIDNISLGLISVSMLQGNERDYMEYVCCECFGHGYDSETKLCPQLSHTKR